MANNSPEIKNLYLQYSNTIKQYEKLINETLNIYKHLETKILDISKTRTELEKILDNLKAKGEDTNSLIDTKNDNPK